ncbi:MAG: molybdenum cofactor guanylyltransferase [Pseudomonadota bacterium]
MKFDCTGVILAGGKNNRFPGKKKTLRRVGDTIILETIYTVFSSLFKEVILVVNDPKEFCGWDMTIVTDIDPSQCALAGLHAGLFYASNPYAFVTACDTPFVKPEIIQYLIDQIEPGYDVIIPKTDDGLEPLSSVYSKACLPLIEENLFQKNFMIKKFFRKNKVKEVEPDQLKMIDPQLRFAFNINTPKDLEMAKIISEKRG